MALTDLFHRGVKLNKDNAATRLTPLKLLEKVGRGA